jgi:hypothetical protein
MLLKTQSVLLLHGGLHQAGLFAIRSTAIRTTRDGLFQPHSATVPNTEYTEFNERCCRIGGDVMEEVDKLEAEGQERRERERGKLEMKLSS